MAHLAYHFLCRRDGGEAGVEGSPAASGGGGIPDGVGIHHGWIYVFRVYAQHLRSR